MLNPGVLIALVAAAVNLSMAVLHFAISRAPGWRIARVFAGMALTACIYDILNTVYCVGGLSPAAYLTAGRLSYLFATVQGLLWLIYAYSDSSGSLRTAPKAIRWVAVSSLVVASVFAATGWLLTPHVDHPAGRCLRVAGSGTPGGGHPAFGRTCSQG